MFFIRTFGPFIPEESLCQGVKNNAKVKEKKVVESEQINKIVAQSLGFVPLTAVGGAECRGYSMTERAGGRSKAI